MVLRFLEAGAGQARRARAGSVPGRRPLRRGRRPAGEARRVVRRRDGPREGACCCCCLHCGPDGGQAAGAREGEALELRQRQRRVRSAGDLAAAAGQEGAAAGADFLVLLIELHHSGRRASSIAWALLRYYCVPMCVSLLLLCCLPRTYHY